MGRVGKHFDFVSVTLLYLRTCYNRTDVKMGTQNCRRL